MLGQLCVVPEGPLEQCTGLWNHTFSIEVLLTRLLPITHPPQRTTSCLEPVSVVVIGVHDAPLSQESVTPPSCVLSEVSVTHSLVGL